MQGTGYFGPTSVRGCIVALLLICLLGFTYPAFAQQAKYSLDDAVGIVKQQVDGRVLRAKTRVVDGQTVHEIRILTEDGHVRTLIVDARTGDVE